MFTLKNEIQFDMAHYLGGYEGKCANIHGHRYRLITYIKRETLHEDGHLRGMVDDFTNIKNVLKSIETFFDHKMLIEDNEEGRSVAAMLSSLDNGFSIELVPFRTTCEEMSRFIFFMLREKGLNVSAVELFETPTNSCTYSED